LLSFENTTEQKCILKIGSVTCLQKVMTSYWTSRQVIRGGFVILTINEPTEHGIASHRTMLLTGRWQRIIWLPKGYIYCWFLAQKGDFHYSLLWPATCTSLRASSEMSHYSSALDNGHNYTLEKFGWEVVKGANCIVKYCNIHQLQWHTQAHAVLREIAWSFRRLHRTVKGCSWFIPNTLALIHDFCSHNFWYN
jgi:hypothetical protein